MKILLNYFQMVSFIKSLDIKWPFYVDEYLKSVAFINSVSTSILSIDCLVNQYNIAGEIVHLKAAFSSILPWCLLFLVILIMLVQLIFKGKNNFNKILLAFFVISIFMHPNILQSLFDNITCLELEDKQYLIKQLDIDCSSNGHIQWVIDKNLNYFNYFSFIILSFLVLFYG